VLFGLLVFIVHAIISAIHCFADVLFVTPINFEKVSLQLRNNFVQQGFIFFRLLTAQEATCLSKSNKPGKKFRT